MCQRTSMRQNLACRSTTTLSSACLCSHANLQNPVDHTSSSVPCAEVYQTPNFGASVRVRQPPTLHYWAYSAHSTWGRLPPQPPEAGYARSTSCVSVAAVTTEVASLLSDVPVRRGHHTVRHRALSAFAWCNQSWAAFWDHRVSPFQDGNLNQAPFRRRNLKEHSQFQSQYITQ